MELIGSHAEATHSDWQHVTIAGWIDHGEGLREGRVWVREGDGRWEPDSGSSVTIGGPDRYAAEVVGGIKGEGCARIGASPSYEGGDMRTVEDVASSPSEDVGNAVGEFLAAIRVG